VRDFVPKGHVSRFIVELVRESLDLREIVGSYVSGLGQPPFDPRMMVALLLHSYASGLYSSRRIAMGLPRTERFCDDCGAGSAGFSHDQRPPQAAF
jgi:transposase